MYVAQLTFALKNRKSTPDEIGVAIDGLLASFRMNGQICGEQQPIAITHEGYVATAMIPEKTALKRTHHNVFVRRVLKRLKNAGLAEPVYVIQKDLSGPFYCRCKRPHSYILYTNRLAIDPPLRCGKCSLPVSLYRIPPTHDKEYGEIIGWASDYQSYDRLQINCRTPEQIATQELSRLDSDLSRRGREICARIYALTQTPTYYYLYREKGLSMEAERERRCPSCGGEWLLPKPWHQFRGNHPFDFKCDHCFLLSSIAWDFPGEGGEFTPDPDWVKTLSNFARRTSTRFRP